MDDLSPEILKILCDYALDGLKIRQSNVPHLVMENIAPEMIERVIRAYRDGCNPAGISRSLTEDLTRLPVEERL